MRFLSELGSNDILALPYLFEFWAMPHQHPPEGNWLTWVILGGRGAGKTRAGAEWVRSEVERTGGARRVAIIGETIEQAREVMIFGDSGLIACSPPDRVPRWEASRKRLIWPNGAVAQLFSAHEPEALRGPQFDLAWSDEIGCPAVDKGSNGPNVFVDPKSSESALPPHSNGRRDDFIQAQYLIAQATHWQDPANNPVSTVYGAPMVDISRAFVWAWDARPFPFFPKDRETWTDGRNYGRGHWINGRTSSRALASVIREICATAGVHDIDVSEVWGVVRGFAPGHVATPREALQVLLAAHGITAVERDGVLRFRSRATVADAWVDGDDLCVSSELSGDLEVIRRAGAETAGRVRINSIEAAGDYQLRASEAVFPDDEVPVVSQVDIPLLLTATEAGEVAERWLAEARAARDGLRMALPPSRHGIGAGDVLSVSAGGTDGLFRVSQVEDGGIRIIEASRIEPEQHRPPGGDRDEPAGVRNFAVPVPVETTFLDLPLLSGQETEHAPFVGFFSNPWPGQVALYKSLGQNGFDLNLTATRAASIGVTETDLPRARAGVIDRGGPVRVRMLSGALASVTDAALWDGANAIAIGDGLSDHWEILQFGRADLVDQDTYDLSRRLRGQLGTDAVIPDVWPAGSRIVALNGALKQVGLRASERQLARVWRAGPATRPVSDPIYRETTRAFDGVGLRPYAPAHLRARSDGAGGHTISWVRRTRIDGDSWAGPDVPLGEESEAYVLRIVSNGAVVREMSVVAPVAAYDAASRTADGLFMPFDVEVAQISARYGAGLFARISVHV